MARTRRPLIAGNWKMNGLEADALTLARAVAAGVKEAGWSDRELLVCPPATLVAAVAHAVKGSGLQVGGQNCHAKASGAHTGDVSAEMLKDAGASHVIVGHSERRADCGETDAIVRAKAEAAWRAGLLPIVCIGETLTQREAGETLEVLETQLKGSVRQAPPQPISSSPMSRSGPSVRARPRRRRGRRSARAHSQGAGRSDQRGAGRPPALRRLGEGSNAAELLAAGDVDGALVGGASLVAAEIFGYRQGRLKRLEAPAWRRCPLKPGRKWTP